MMALPESTSADAFDRYAAGRLVAASTGWKDLLVRIYAEYPVEESIIVPAVAEPHIVWVVSGAAVVEERELGVPWLKTRIDPGDFFLTASNSPYELRRKAIGPEPFGTMHLHLGLPVFTRAIEEAFEKNLETICGMFPVSEIRFSLRSWKGCEERSHPVVRLVGCLCKESPKLWLFTWHETTRS